MSYPRLPHAVFALACLTAALLSAPLAGQSPDSAWPRWRGPHSDGNVSSGKHIFDAPFSLKVRWKRSIGAGYSGIAASGGRLVTMSSDGKTDVVIALSADDGRDLWRVPLGPAFPGKDGSTGGPVSTPAIDNGVAFALGPLGNLLGLNLADGRQLWSHDLVKEFGAAEPHWGFTTSPLTAHNLVIVAVGGTNGHAVMAFDQKTGTIAWKTGDDTVSYASPMLATLGGRDVLVVGGDRYLFGLDPRTGAELWKYEHSGVGFYGRIINPVAVGGKGVLTTSKPDASVLIEPGGPSARNVWTSRDLKLNYGTPVLHNGVIFGYSGTILSAVDASTGELKWRSRPPGDGFAIVVDDHLVIVTKHTGEIVVAPAVARGFEPKATVTALSNLVWTPPSFAEGRIYVRDSYEEIAAVDVVGGGGSMTSADPDRPGIIAGSKFAAWVGETEKAPDAAARVDSFLAAQKAFPIIEGERIVHVVYRGDGSNLLFRSDVIGTGVDWPMHRVANTDLYYVSLEVEPDARVSYQLARTFGDPFGDPRNAAKTTSGNFAGDVSALLMPRALSDLPRAGALRGKVVNLEFDAGTAAAAHLKWGGKRPVQVYLPPAYDADPSRRYPTLYVMYGDELRNNGHLDVALERQMGAAMDESIIVFLPSTSGYEYARTFRQPHLKMMGEQLIPWIDGQFRTRPQAADRTLIGGDEAGFAAIEIGLTYPQVFGTIMAQSLYPLSAGDAELMALIDRTPPTRQRFYVDWGRYDPRRRSDKLDVRDFSSRVHARLKARGFSVSGREWNDGSTYLFWSDRLVRALRTR